jgi:hypothetical protein
MTDKKDDGLNISIGHGDSIFALGLIILFLLVFTNNVGNFMKCVFAHDCSGWM